MSDFLMRDFRLYGSDLVDRDPIKIVQQRLLEIMRANPHDFSPGTIQASRGYGLDGAVGPTMRDALSTAIQRGHLPPYYGNVVVGSGPEAQAHNRQLFARALAHERTGSGPFTGPQFDAQAPVGPLNQHQQAIADFQDFARAMGRTINDPPGHVGDSTLAAYAGGYGQAGLGDRALYNRFAQQMRAEIAGGRLTLEDQQRAFASLLGHPTSQAAFQARGQEFLTRTTPGSGEVNFFTREGATSSRDVVQGYISGSPVRGATIAPGQVTGTGVGDRIQPTAPLSGAIL